MTVWREGAKVGKSTRECESPGSDIEVGEVSQARKGRKSIPGRVKGMAKCREKRSHCNAKPVHCTQRVAPASLQLEKILHSNEDPAQPNGSKDFFKKRTQKV